MRRMQTLAGVVLVALVLAGVAQAGLGTPSEVWVDDDYTGVTPGWGTIRFAAIQDGVNAVAAGGIVNVAVGVYSSYAVTVDKSVTIKGAQAGVPAVDGGRAGGESVVRPLSGDKYGGFVITADNVTVDGFHALDCYEPFTSEIRRALHKNVTIANNYVTGVNNWSAVSLMRNGGVDSTFEDYTIRGNYIDAATGRGIGLSAGSGTLYLYDGLTITGNTIKCPGNYGIFAGGTVSKFEVHDAVITGNTLACNSGINIAKLLNPTITGNTITAIGASGTGISVGAQNGVVSNNDITGGATASGTGINVYGGQYGSWVGGGLQVTNNDVTRATTGLQLRGGVDGATVSSNTLTDCTTGILIAANGTPSIDTFSTSTDVTDNTIAGTGDTGVLVDGITGPATEIDLGATTIADTYGEYVQLKDTTLNVDATGTNLGGLGTDAEVEAKVYHDVDVATLGHVDWGQGAATGTSLTVADVAGGVGDTVQLTAKLKAGSAPLPGQSVSFTVDGNAVGSGTTDGAGIAHASYTIVAAGAKPIVASFSGVSNYKAATGTGTLTAAAATATGITLTVTPGSVASGATATCTVLGDNGVDYTSACKYYVQYGAGGSWADNVYTAGKAGTWSVTAVYNTLTDSESLTVTHGTATGVTLTPSNATINADGSQTYTVTATDAGGNTWTPDASCLSEDGAGSFTDYTYNAAAGDAGSAVRITATVDAETAGARLDVNAAAGPGTILAWDKDTRKFYLCSNPTDPATGTEITGTGTFNGVACVVSGGGTDVTVAAGGASLRVAWYLRGGALYRACQYSRGTASGAQTATYYGGRTLLGGTWRTGYWGLVHNIPGASATLGVAQQ